MTSEFSKVELVGGPFCGLRQDWPVHDQTMEFWDRGYYMVYEMEGNGQTAMFRGWRVKGK